MNENEKRVTAFLYLLMRDKLPVGEVAELVRDASIIAHHNEVNYESDELAALSLKKAQHLLYKHREDMGELWLRVENGMTVAQLRSWLDRFADEGEVWLTNYGDGLTNVCVEAAPLNREDVLLSPREKEKCQCEFETVARDKDGTVRQCRKCGETRVG